MQLSNRVRKTCTRVGSSRSIWTHIELAPRDAILGLNEAFKEDKSSTKVNLGVGAYRDDNGKPVVLPSVREAERRVLNKSMDHEYSTIGGCSNYIKNSIQFAYGMDSDVIKQERVAAIQTLSGTGACRVVGEFISKFFGKGKKMYLPDPTWGNHIPIMANSGLVPTKYRYYNTKTNSIDFNGLMDDINKAENQSVFMLHAAAHNPTGCDPTKQQWNELSKGIKQKGHIIFFDNAYQGFASGNSEDDAYSIRKFVSDGHHIMLAQSFAKNFGLYGERIGTLSVVTANKEEKERVESQLKTIVRPMYSNPPIYGARIVNEILSDPTLKKQWNQECKEMADRIKSMRHLLRTELEKKTTKSWNHITDQIGMFCYTGLTPSQVTLLKEKYHIYCTADGRFSMAGINSKNVHYIAEAVAAVEK